jgi:hypothetical protein
MTMAAIHTSFPGHVGVAANEFFPAGADSHMSCADVVKRIFSVVRRARILPIIVGDGLSRLRVLRGKRPVVRAGT